MNRDVFFLAFLFESYSFLFLPLEMNTFKLVVIDNDAACKTRGFKHGQARQQLMLTLSVSNV